MHSFHHSRGRIVFEVLCALTIGAACAVAWLQTGASAMLAIAGVATLYGLVHATDALRRSPPVVAALPDAEPKAEDQVDLVAEVGSAQADPVADEAPKAPKVRASRKKKAVVEVVAEPAAAESEVAAAVLDEPPAAECEEPHHAIVTPLFEPVPIVRQPRTFGRKAG